MQWFHRHDWPTVLILTRKTCKFAQTSHKSHETQSYWSCTVLGIFCILFPRLDHKFQYIMNCILNVFINLTSKKPHNLWFTQINKQLMGSIVLKLRIKAKSVAACNSNDVKRLFFFFSWTFNRMKTKAFKTFVSYRSGRQNPIYTLLFRIWNIQCRNMLEMLCKTFIKFKTKHDLHSTAVTKAGKNNEKHVEFDFI